MRKLLSSICLVLVLLFAVSAIATDRVVVIPLNTCSDGLTKCSHKCVDTMNNPSFCGDCQTDCGADQYCSQGACVRHDGLACTDSTECMSGNCADGVCCDSSCDSLCDSCLAASTGGTDGTCGRIIAGTNPDSECPGATFCLADGTCSPSGKDNGAACSGGTDCISGNCVDGVCCDSSCDSLCESCLAAATGGTDGACADITWSTDPDGDCEITDYVCDGAGACKGLGGADCRVIGINVGGDNTLCLSDDCFGWEVMPGIFTYTCN